MNCPKCGLQILQEQKFCRSCGNSLQIITQPLVEDAALPALEKTSATDLINERPQVNRLTQAGFIIMFLGVATGVTGKMLTHDEMITFVGVLAFVLGMFLTVYPQFMPSPRRKLTSKPSSQAEVLSQAASGKYLPEESYIEYVPSITEKTTDLLKNSIATSPRPKEDRESKA
jgi:hypothetical protein